MEKVPMHRRVNILDGEEIIAIVPVELPASAAESEVIAEGIREAARLGIFHGRRLHALSFAVEESERSPQ